MSKKCAAINDEARKLVIDLTGTRAPSFKDVTYPTTEMAKSMQPMTPTLVGLINVPVGSNSVVGSKCVKALLNETQFAGLHKLMLPAF